MSCAALQSGSHFLGTLLGEIDCQAQTIGAYGYGALASPSSPAAGLLLGALTLFIALFGLRLMFGNMPGARDVTGEILKIGIVLTLATSWPAWRTFAYDLVLDGPAQIAGSVGLASGLPGGHGDLAARLDNADQGVISLTAFGTGRLTGGIVGSSDLGDSARGIALADQSGLSWGRIAFLTGTIGPLGIVRLSAGILLAFAPIMALLLLFAGTRDLFFGWLRALGACAIGSAVLALIYGAELAVLESWLAGVLAQRQANVLTPAAPTELVVLGLAFMVMAFGGLGLVVRMMFFSGQSWPRWLSALHLPSLELPSPRLQPALVGAPSNDEPVRVQRVAEALEQTMRRERRLSEITIRSEVDGTDERQSRGGREGGVAASERLGSSWRRGHRRVSAAASTRDAAP